MNEYNIQKGVIQHRERRQQILDMSGLQYSSITPSDIDACLEFGRKVFVLIEAKYGNAPMPAGQRYMYEHLAQAISDGHHAVLVIICRHNVDNTDEDVDLSIQPVTHAYMTGAYPPDNPCNGIGWYYPQKFDGDWYSVRELIDEFLISNGMASKTY